MYVHPADLRHANTRRIFRRLLSGTPCSRADLARVTGISAVTVGKVVDDLIAMKLVEESFPDSRPVGSSGPTMGRPPRILRLSPRTWFVALQVGVRTTILSRLALNGQELRREEFTSGSTLEEFLANLRAARRRLGGDTPTAILVSLPGVVDAQAGVVLYSPNLHYTEGDRLLREIASMWRAPLCAVQEVQALALGRLAAVDTPDSFLLVEFADGVGGAVITHGKLMESPVPLSGEIGHMPVVGNDRRCGCGAIGCVETLASRRGLLQSFKESTRKRAVTWEGLVEHVREHGIEPWLERSIDAAAFAVAGATNLLGISDVVIVGDLPHLREGITEAMERGIREHSLWGRFGNVTCVAAPSQKALGLLAAVVDRVLLPEPSTVNARALAGSA